MSAMRRLLFLCYILVLVFSNCNCTSLLIRKCCPESQHLDLATLECIGGRFEVNITNIEKRKTKDFIDFPDWFDNDIHSEISVVLGNNSEYHIELGAKQPCGFNMTVVLNSSEIASYRILANGTLLYHASTGTDVRFSPETYCVDKAENRHNSEDFSHVVLVCPCLYTNCVKKCCAADEIMQIVDAEGKSECIKSAGNNTWASFEHGVILNEKVQNEQYIFNCSNSNETDVVNIWTLKNISVFSNFAEEDVDGFCGEMAVVKRGGGTMSAVLRCSMEPKPEAKKNKELSNIIYPISATFLIFTLVVFALVPETRNTKSNIVICHIISLLAIYVLRTTGRRPDNGVFTDAECYVLFFFHHFFYLSASFWITALCLDIAMTFRVFRPTRSIMQPHKQKRRFFWYSIICWSGPALFLIAIAIMEFTPGIPDHYYRPEIAAGTCGIWGYERVWIYFHGPQIVLSVINSFLLVYMLVKICNAHCSMGMLDSEDSSRHMNKNDNSCMTGKKRYIVYINLLCLMGPPRLIPMIHWALTNDWDLVIYLDYVGDILRAISLMLFVCCKPGIPQLLLKRLKSIAASIPCFKSCMQKKPRAAENGNYTFKDLKDKESSGVSDSSALSNTDS